MEAAGHRGAAEPLSRVPEVSGPHQGGVRGSREVRGPRAPVWEGVAKRAQGGTGSLEG